MTGRLLKWYDANRRDLPWRNTHDPYAIWVSEIMLQQTQVSTVIDYWRRWLERFPDVESLAEADDQEVLAMWQGLGYYRRAKLLHRGAKFVAKNGMPVTADEWRAVPGIGPYTAGAIASIGFGEAAALVDGNVERVYARVSGDESVGTILNRNAWRWAKEMIPQFRPGDHNQALMELGATVCKPKGPECDRCPISDDCSAKRDGLTEVLPRAATRPTLLQLAHTVWVPSYSDRLGLVQIPKGSWWEDMWEFPGTERRETFEARPHGAKALGSRPSRVAPCLPFDPSESGFEGECPTLRRMTGPGPLRYLESLKHTVTHHQISITAWTVDCLEQSKCLEWFTREELISLPLPAPQRKLANLFFTSMSQTDSSRSSRIQN